jgi:hypothetical protein
MPDRTLSHSLITVALALIVAFAALAVPAADPDRINVVPGEKLDSGLGDMPPWNPAPDRINPVVGEKLDSGLGDLTARPPQQPAGAQPATKVAASQ